MRISNRMLKCWNSAEWCRIVCDWSTHNAVLDRWRLHVLNKPCPLCVQLHCVVDTADHRLAGFRVLWAGSGHRLMIIHDSRGAQSQKQRESAKLLRVTSRLATTDHAVHCVSPHHVTRLTTVSWSAVVSGSKSWSVCGLHWELAILAV